MNSIRLSLQLLLLGLLFLLVVSMAVDDGAVSGDPPTLPRYALKVGQELRYTGTNEFKHENGSHETSGSWTVWVLGKNADESWRLLIRMATSFSSGGLRQPERVQVARFDLFPDGRLVYERKVGAMIEPTNIFPRLPADSEEAKSGWSFEDSDVGTTHKYRVAEKSPRGKNAWLIEYEPKSLFDKIYDSSSSMTIRFDPKKGLPTRIDSRNRQGYGFQGKGEGQTVLEEVIEHDLAEIGELAEESEVYLEAQDRYMELFMKAYQGGGDVEPILSKAEESLKSGLERITVPALRKGLKRQIEQHAQQVEYVTQGARERAEVLGKRSPEWETTDFSGKKHSIGGHAGKVVVLDFWYRGCGWCIRAMPQIKQLAEDYKDKPVAFLGMNTDREESDARFVIEAMKLNYPNLRAQGLPEKYKVRGFPTLIIIDPKGIVRDVHVGYSPQLREEVKATVEKLLSE